MNTVVRLLIDAVLVTGFGLQHSGLATLRVKRSVEARSGISPLAWRSAESLCNVIYILVAALLWQQSDVVVWRLSGVAAVAVYGMAIISWLWYWELHLYEYDCGLAFGSTTLVAKLAGVDRPRIVPWKVGSRRWIRFPVHTAFFGMFFFIPTMTADLLVLAAVANVYNVVGSILYDRRLQRLAGGAYKQYMAATGLIWPPVYRAPRGAADIAMPSPSHWRRPSMHLPGLLAGVILAGIYILMIGHATLAPASIGRAAAGGLAGAAVAGVMLGRVVRPQATDWAQRQTDLSTTVALGAASAVVMWAAAEWVATGGLPAFAVFLPLWFTVQYLGHVFAFLSAPRKWSPRSTPTLSRPEESAPAAYTAVTAPVPSGAPR